MSKGKYVLDLRKIIKGNARTIGHKEGAWPEELRFVNYFKPVGDRSEKKKYKKGGEDIQFDSISDFKVPLAFEVAEYIGEHFTVYAENETEVLYIYDEDTGCFQHMDKRDFRVFLQSVFVGHSVMPMLLEPVQMAAFRFLLGNPSKQIKRDVFDRQEGYITVENGVVEIASKELKKHAPKYGATRALTVPYYEKEQGRSKRPKIFCRILKETFPDKDDRRRFLECCGYYISNCCTRKVAFVWVGKPHSGKSALQRLITKIVGEKNVSNLPLRRLGDRFAIAQLADKKLNICGETGTATIKNLDVFKALLGNDNIEAEFKGRDMFSFSGRCKCLFAGNGMLNLDDEIAEEAVFSRFEFIGFDREVPPKKRVPFIEDVLIEKEGSQILRLIICALRKWYKNGCIFTESKSSLALKKRFIRQNSHSDYVQNFIEDCCELGARYSVSNNEIYNAYVSYAEKNCLPSMEPRQFIKRMLLHPQLKKHRFHHSKNSQFYGIKGIRVKSSHK